MLGLASEGVRSLRELPACVPAVTTGGDQTPATLEPVPVLLLPGGLYNIRPGGPTWQYCTEGQAVQHPPIHCLVKSIRNHDLNPTPNVYFVQTNSTYKQHITSQFQSKKLHCLMAASRLGKQSLKRVKMPSQLSLWPLGIQPVVYD